MQAQLAGKSTPKNGKSIQELEDKFAVEDEGDVSRCLGINLRRVLSRRINWRLLSELLIAFVLETVICHNCHKHMEE